MTPATLIDYRQQLEKADREVEGAQRHVTHVTRITAETKPPDLEVIEEFARTARRWTTRFNQRIPVLLSSDARDEIRNRLLQAVEILEREAFAGDRVLDHLDQLLVHLEAVRHIFRDALDGDVPVDLDDAQALIQQLVVWLPQVDREDLAGLVGVSVRTMQRWLKGGGQAGPRLQLVTQLVALLRRAWTPQGVVAWFHRPRPDLQGRNPLEVLDDRMYHEILLEAARRGRAGHGS